MIAMVATGWLAAIMVMALLWLIHLKIRNAGIVDVGWAGVMVLFAVVYFFMADGWTPRRVFVVSVAALWGGRLAVYLLATRVIGKPEEGRYRKLRQSWGQSANLRLFWFFQLQAFLAAVLSLPFLLASNNVSTSFHPVEIAGFALWSVAFIGEVAADAQLEAFKRRAGTSGRTCRDGLWRYSRHPNYFFEWLIWCAFFLIALPAPWGFTAIVCPAMMLYFLLKVTGIPATEAQALRTRGEDYRQYQATTSVFVPWFPGQPADAPCKEE